MLQPCPASDEVDDVPATLLARIRCCCASELDSLSSCYTLTCGCGSLVKSVIWKIWLELKEDGQYRNNTDRIMKKIDTKHIDAKDMGCRNATGSVLDYVYRFSLLTPVNKNRYWSRRIIHYKEEQYLPCLF